MCEYENVYQCIIMCVWECIQVKTCVYEDLYDGVHMWNKLSIQK